jgi:hypothetical protein
MDLHVFAQSPLRSTLLISLSLVASACGDSEGSGTTLDSSGELTGPTGSDTSSSSSEDASTATATASGDGDGDASTDTDPTDDTTTTATTGDPEYLEPSQSPPGGLTPAQVPVFVSLGWDDNAYSGLDASAGGMDWARQAFNARTNSDGSPALASFYFTSIYIGVWQAEDPGLVKEAWNQAMVDGHEVGVHTHSHLHGAAFTESEWDDELQICIDWLTKPFNASEPPGTPDDAAGIGASMGDLAGFRTPFLEYNEATLDSVESHGFRYDCSIEEGWQPEHGPGEFNYPYTLDGGSPGHEVLVEWGSKEPIEPHPGLWEMPAYPVVVPPDDVAADYGIAPGLRDKCYGIASWFDTTSGKITGFDYNLWVSFQMTKAEFVATLKYTLDQRIEGNHAPFLFGTHSDYYSDKYTAAMPSTPAERREAIEEFLDYATSLDEVRVTSTEEVLDWMQNPTPL